MNAVILATEISTKDMKPTIQAAFVQAIEAAEAFVGATAPNPPVGCVILDRDGAVLARGAHERAGTPHAEAQALQRCHDSGRFAQIDTIVVTLEPCNHWGRTPPCTEAILASPATSVWFGMADPNSNVAGGGAVRLRAAGLAVHALADQAGPAAASLHLACGALIAPFAKRAATGRPWVTIKQALDEKGSMIPPAGAKTFTSDAALAFAHRLRRRADALVTGSGTILADQPEFTVRRVTDFPGKHRGLVVLDRRGRVPRSYIDAAAARGFTVAIERAIEPVLDRLGQEGALEVLVEAGPNLTAAWLDGGLWDEHIVIVKNGGPEGADAAEIRLRADGSVRHLVLTADGATLAHPELHGGA